MIIWTGFRIRKKIVFLEEIIQYTVKKGSRLSRPETEWFSKLPPAGNNLIIHFFYKKPCFLNADKHKIEWNEAISNVKDWWN